MNILSNIQERISSIPTVNVSLQDGLVTYEILKEIDEKIHELSDRVFDTKQARGESERTIVLLEEVKTKVLSFEDLAEKYTIVKRWIGAGYDRDFITTDPEAVTFFGTADFRAIQLFKNATSQLSGADMDLHFDREHGKVLFKVQGEWKSFSKIKDQITYDPENEKLNGWTYLHPKGLVPTDITELRPFAQLSAHAHEALKKVAWGFWSDSQPEIDPGVDKPCTLQVFVKVRNPSRSLLKNFNLMKPIHCYVRLADSKGQLYSCGGAGGSKKEKKLVFPGGRLPYTFITANWYMHMLDKMEFDPFLADSVSIPISIKRFSKIKERYEAINKNGGFRFSILRGNCCLNDQEILELAGVNIDTRLTLSQVLSASLPAAEDIPYIGSSLAAISSVCFSCLSRIPSPVKKYGSWAGKVVCFIPKMVLRTLSKVPIIALKGAQGTKTTESQQKNPIAADFKRKAVIQTPLDIFRSTIIYHSEMLRAWIKRQNNYQLLDQTHHLCMVKDAFR